MNLAWEIAIAQMMLQAGGALGALLVALAAWGLFAGVQKLRCWMGLRRSRGIMSSPPPGSGANCGSRPDLLGIAPRAVRNTTAGEPRR